MRGPGTCHRTAKPMDGEGSMTGAGTLTNPPRGPPRAGTFTTNQWLLIVQNAFLNQAKLSVLISPGADGILCRSVQFRQPPRSSFATACAKKLVGQSCSMKIYIALYSSTLFVFNTGPWNSKVSDGFLQAFLFGSYGSLISA